MSIAVDHRLMSGEEYLASLRDSREIWYRGARIDDVTAHPVTAAACAFQASMYDLQHDPASMDTLTYVDDEGVRRPMAWLVPRSPEQLSARVAEAEFRSWRSFGALHARQPNHIASNLVGQLGYLNALRAMSPDHADNLPAIVDRCSRENLHVTGSIVEPQGTRARSAKAGDDRSSVMRVVRRSSEGVWISGAKAVGTAAVQAHEIVIGSIYYPHVREDEAFWAILPIASPGLRLICREAVADPTSPFDHPVSTIGEEMDALVVLEEVFVPHSRLWALDAPPACDPALFGMTGRIEFLTHLVRQAVRAEFFAGLGQAIVEALELKDIVMVQDHLGELSQFASILRGGVRAALASAEPVEDGVLHPDGALVNAFRIYGLENYPHMTHLLQQLSSQGLVARFSEADFEQFGTDLERFMGTSALNAREKNVLMNLVWDSTSGAVAGRASVFENVNGLPPSIMRHLLYFIYDRSQHANRVRASVGLTTEEQSDPAAATAAAWIATRSRAAAASS